MIKTWVENQPSSLHHSYLSVSPVVAAVKVYFNDSSELIKCYCFICCVWPAYRVIDKGNYSCFMMPVTLGNYTASSSCRVWIRNLLCGMSLACSIWKKELGFWYTIQFFIGSLELLCKATCISSLFPPSQLTSVFSNAMMYGMANTRNCYHNRWWLKILCGIMECSLKSSFASVSSIAFKTGNINSWNPVLRLCKQFFAINYRISALNTGFAAWISMGMVLCLCMNWSIFMKNSAKN